MASRVKKIPEVYTRAYKDALFRAIEEEHGLQDLTEEEKKLPLLEQPRSERTNVYVSILGDTEDFRVIGKVVQVGNITQLTPYRTYRLENPPEPEYRLENCTEQKVEEINDGVALLISRAGKHYQAPINRYAKGVEDAKSSLGGSAEVTAYVDWSGDNPQVVAFEVEEPEEPERYEVQGKLDLSVF